MPSFFPKARSFPRYDARLTLILAGILVGCLSGLAGVALNHLIIWLFEGLHHARENWWSFFLPGLGAALSSLFLHKIVNEGAGHGVPEVIYSVTRRGGLLRLRSSFSRLVSSWLTIGFGGSAGPEAPIVMSGAAIGSNMARLFSLPDNNRVTLLACGAAGAIGSIFNAPIAGIVFSLEVILGEWRVNNIIPIGVAAVAGTKVSRALQGNQIPFSHTVFPVDLGDLLATVGLALAAALASVLFTRMMRKSHSLWSKLPSSPWIRAALGGFLVGAVGFFFPVVLGEGYHTINEMIGGNLNHGFFIVALAALLKIACTSITLGSGGSGGIFAPSLLIGSLVGTAYHRLLVVIWPSVEWAPEGCFALLGMAGLMGGMLQAPLTAIFLIQEITGGYGVILPLIIVSLLSSSTAARLEPVSFYFKDLVAKGDLLRPGTDARVLSELKVTELLEQNTISVDEEMPLGRFVEIVKISRRDHFPVFSKAGRFSGMVELGDVRPYLFQPDLYEAVLICDVMDPAPQTASPGESLAEILARMDHLGKFSLPVVHSGKFLGMISKGTILNHYRKELILQTNT